MTPGREERRRTPAVSVVVPVAEHPEELAGLYREFAEPLRQARVHFEFLFVSGPEFAHLLAPLRELAEAGEPVRILSVGQPAADGVLIRSAEPYCEFPIILTLPSYRRVEATSLLDLLAAIRDGADIATARRFPRRDSGLNRLQNRVLHGALRLLTGAKIRDVACGVRAFRRELLREVPLYGDLFRFFPVIAQRMGYRLVELDAPQHSGDVRSRMYQPEIYVRRIVDLLGLFVVLRFTQKPLRFFGWIGAVLTSIGSGVILILLIDRIQYSGVVSRPLLLTALTFIMLGIQAFALGLVGEIMVFLHTTRGTGYRVTEETPPGS
ncbi:MAG: hypothetical protein ACREL6_07460 [Gemmatimonadales bacterium]